MQALGYALLLCDTSYPLNNTIRLAFILDERVEAQTKSISPLNKLNIQMEKLNKISANFKIILK